MKILVTSIPSDPKNCLFSREEHDTSLRSIETGEVYHMYQYYCNVNNKPCNMYCGGKCNKLIMLKGE
jgi:hypothetical protein